MLGMALLLPHILLSSNPRGAGLGGTLALVGVLGLIALVVWPILPRWRAILPRRLHGPILAIRELPGVRTLHDRIGGYERWRSLHRLTGVFVGVGFLHGVSEEHARRRRGAAGDRPRAGRAPAELRPRTVRHGLPRGSRR
jgi:hypothetical protein